MIRMAFFSGLYTFRNVGLCAIVFIGAPSKIVNAKAVRSTGYDLEKFIAAAESSYPGIDAARHGLDAMREQLFQARWAWLPRGALKGRAAPTPRVRCLPDDKLCTTTSIRNASLNIRGVFGSVQIEAGLPLYTFDKLGALKRAARAGVSAREAAVGAAKQDVRLHVSEAYWGVKVAREILRTIAEGRKHIDKAIRRIDRELDEGTGDSTVSDLLRLKAKSAEIDTRSLEAVAIERLALSALSTLTGLKAGLFDVDDGPLRPLSTRIQDADFYLDQGGRDRPEVRMLYAAERAGWAKVDLEKAAFYPDLLLVGSFGIAGANAIDDPPNIFYQDPFNFFGGGVALVLDWKLNTIEQIGRYRAARAEALQVVAKRKEARAGIDLEIRKSWIELKGAKNSMAVALKGEKASRRWLVATSQNIEAGLAESKDLTDALVSFFTSRLAYLNAIFNLNVGWARLTRAVGTILHKEQAESAHH